MRDTDGPTRHPELLQAAGCLLVLACALVALTMAARPLFEPRSVTLAEVAALTGLSFPPSAALRSAGFVDGPRPSLAATVALPRADVEAFVEQANWTVLEPGETAGMPPGAERLEPADLSGIRRAAVTPPRRDPRPRWSQNLVVADLWLLEARRGPCLLLIEAAGS